MNRYADDRSAEHADDAQRLLERLREVGEAGITTGELIREGRCGLRPPNRIGDLRRQGQKIKTIREENGVFRFVLVHENPSPQRPRKRDESSKAQAEQRGETEYMKRTRQERDRAMPLFAATEKRE